MMKTSKKWGIEIENKTPLLENTLIFGSCPLL
jgi:hypothetical protein